MRSPAANSQPARPFLMLLCSCLLFVFFEAVLFRSGLYDSVLEPDSNAGRFEYTLTAETKRPPSGKMEFLVLGDSRVSEGFSEKLADQYLNLQPLKLVNRAVPGTTPRVWYYQLREMDPDRKRYQGIVLCVSHFADYDYGTDYFYADAINDYRYLITRLGYGDIAEFAGSFHKSSLRKEAALALTLKGFALKHDLWAFLRAPQKRLAKRAQYDEGWVKWQYDYGGRSGIFAGLEYDPQNQRIHFPPEVSVEEQQAVNDHLHRHLGPTTGAMAAFNRKWLGKIVDHYRGSTVQVFFTVLPRHPVFPLYPRQTDPGSVIGQLALQEHVHLLPEEAFAHINRQENFIDFMHVNNKGRKVFTEALCAELRKCQAEAGAEDSIGGSFLSGGIGRDAF